MSETTVWINRFQGLQSLPEDIQRILVSRSQVVAVPAGTVIFGPGNIPDNLLLLLEGTVRVSQTSEGGREIVLYRVEAGESCVLTTACLLAQEAYSAEGVAETDVKAVAIPRQVFNDLVSAAPAFRDFVFAAYAGRITNLFRVIERRRGLPVTLGIIYIHVGRAMGYRVDGLAFPGHFLIRLDTPGGRAILDPFFGGIQRDAAALRDLLKTVRGQDAELNPADYEPVPDMDVLNRVQNNIKLRLMQADKKQEAATVCETMLMYNPRDAVLWREAGLLHAETSNMRAALAALTNYVDIVPESSERRQIVALMRELRLKLN